LSWLLDTCVISELIKPRPRPSVVSWLSSQEEEHLFLSSITLGEIQKGVSKLPESLKRSGLQEWLDLELTARFKGRILGIDSSVAKKWGEIQALSERSGIKMPVVDSLIAAIAMVHDLTVVTRNIHDLEPSGVRLFNPWE